MSDIAIHIESLGKKFRIGALQQSHYRYRSLRDALAGAASSFGSRIHLPSRISNAPAPENEIWALRDVSLDVKVGEVVGIIGRNGAGKSTLLKVLSRITEPTEGYVRLEGHVGSLLEVGTGFHPELTGRENIYLNGAILGMKKAEIARKFDEIVDFAEVERFIDTPVKHFSSGMYLRLAFAVAAHLEPEILVVDEVLAVGDAAFQKKCLGKMGDVAREGRTVLFVSHNMTAVEDLCNRALLLVGGRIRLISHDVRQVITDYLYGRLEANASCRWVNEGDQFANPYFKPTVMFVCDAGGSELVMPLRNDVEAWVQIEGEIDLLDPAMNVGYAIYDENGALLYWSYQTDSKEADWPVLSRGRCALRGRLPRRFLNEGTYKLELIAGLHFRQWLLRPGVNCPSVQITIQGGLSESPLWMVRRPGILAPVMQWKNAADVSLFEFRRNGGFD